jgi:hypothetical protein
MSTVILLKNDDLTRNTILGGNIDVSRYVPAIKDFQKTRLKEVLGKTLYDKISSDFEAESLSGLYLELYEDYIKEMCIHGAAENYLTFGAYQVTNVGITKAKTENSETVNKTEVDFMVQSSRKLLEHYEREFTKWIKLNPLPEYPITVRNNNNINNVGGWVLRKKDCCK